MSLSVFLQIVVGSPVSDTKLSEIKGLKQACHSVIFQLLDPLLLDVVSWKNLLFMLQIQTTSNNVIFRLGTVVS